MGINIDHPDYVAHEVFTRVRTPSSAERVAAERKWGPFSSFRFSLSHITSLDKWPVTFVVMWATCKTPDEAALHWNRLSTWGRHVYRDLPDHLIIVQELICEALRAGAITAWGRLSPNVLGFVPVPLDHWQTSLDWETDAQNASAKLTGQPVHWFDVRIPQVELRALAGRIVARLAEIDSDVEPSAHLFAEAAKPASMTPLGHEPTLDEVALAREAMRSSSLDADTLLRSIKASDRARAYRGEPIAPRHEVLRHLQDLLGKDEVGSDRSKGAFRDAFSRRGTTAVRGGDKTPGSRNA